jgi:hypothetical protein
VRRAQGRLGRLARNSSLLALAGVICIAAGSASAKPAPTAFRLTISGNVHQKWDHTSAPVLRAGCEHTVRAEGIRNFGFFTARSVIVRFDGARLLPVRVRGLRGTGTVAGANTVTDVCGSGRTQAIQDCVLTRQSFKGGSIGALGTRAGSITLRRLRDLRLASISCPQEPAEVLAAPLGPVPGPLRVPVAALRNRRIAHVTLTASASRGKNYGSPEDGTLEQRSVWTLSFTRLRP